MATDSKIIIGIDNEFIELTGKDKEDFLIQRSKDNAEIEAKETAKIAKTATRSAVLKRLGLTEEEAAALLS